MYSVAQVLRAEFGRSWHEAVAIVQEAAQLLHPGQSLPGPEDLLIDEAGTLTFGFGDESSEDPVSALAGLLDRLLNGVEAPSSLRDLVRENASPKPAHGSIASFSQALAFFERPNRANDIRAVVSRLSGFRDRSSTEQEFERLREKVANTPEPEAAARTEVRRKRTPKLSRRQQALAVAAVCLLLFGTLGFRAGLHRNLGSLTASAESGVQSAVSAGLETLGVSRAPSTRPAGEPVEAERREAGADRAVRASAPRGTSGNLASRRPAERIAPPTAARRGTPQRAGADEPARTESSQQSLKARPLTAVPSLAAPPPPPAAVAEPTAVAVRPGAVYSSADVDVQAPILVRPQLPRDPPPGSDTGIFDMLIDENGDVMQVKLISPRRRYHDRMLVAAAKAWKFRPAMLNGQPVKYRVRIPIILTGMP